MAKDEEKSIEKEYKFLQDNIKGLPEYDLLNFEFEIETLEANDFILRNILKKVMDRYDSILKYLEELLQPEGSVSALYECTCFDEQGKKEIFDLYKKLMIYHRRASWILIETDDKNIAQYLSDLLAEWQSIKDRTAAIIKKVEDAWKKDS
ncbi:hypothetical protein ACFL0W_06460, partial [Nanoarchaeota archaeon]